MLHQDKTYCPKGHPYSGNNLYTNPNTQKRTCKTCQKSAQAVYNQKISNGYQIKYRAKFCKSGHDLNDPNIIYIQPNNRRICKVCRNSCRINC